jgi:hypothetical protein
LTLRARLEVKLQKIYDAAAMAERANNPCRMYQAIRSLAPKQTFQKVNIRSEAGDLLGPEQAADRLQEWFSELYHADAAPASLHAFDWPFTCTEFQHYNNCHLPRLWIPGMLRLHFGGGRLSQSPHTLTHSFKHVDRMGTYLLAGVVDTFASCRRQNRGHNVPRIFVPLPFWNRVERC